MTIYDRTILNALCPDKWWTCAMVVGYLNQAGPSIFGAEWEYRQYNLATRRNRYRAIHNKLQHMRKSGKIDYVLGDDNGNEVRVYRLLTPSETDNV